MNTENIIYIIKKETGIDLRNNYIFDNELDNNLNNLLMVKYYLNSFVGYVLRNIEYFYVGKSNIWFGSNATTNNYEYLHETHLGDFIIASKLPIISGYDWEFHCQDRFGLGYERLTVNKDKLLYKYLDALFEYCKETNNIRHYNDSDICKMTLF